jgi:serine/threonine protein kinase/Flp pilus assembly protein TadD
MPLAAGQRVGVYEIVGSLGSGGMGEVYQARDTRLGRMVAIKFVSEEFTSDRTSAERLVREARLTSRLNHPNIVTVHDVGELESRPFIVMEFVAGQSLHAALLEGRFKATRAIDVAGQVADGLSAAHAAGVVHRDLKPRNIMLTEDGRAKIVDFGIGKTNSSVPGADDATFEAGRTDTLKAAGTPGYMAPEQVAGRPIDFRADQFALGAIVYEMITGRRAFKRETTAQTMAAIIEVDPAPIAELSPEAPDGLITIIERCLAKDPAHRYGSTQDLARDLRDLRGTSPGSRTSRSAAAAKTTRRRSTVGAIVFTFVIAATIAAAWFAWSRVNGPLSEARALLVRYDKQANVDRAIALLTPLASSSPSDPAVHTLLAEAYSRKFESDVKNATLSARAGEEAGLALTINQSYAPAHVVLAMINSGQRRFDGALGEAQRAIALDAKNSRGYRELGRAQFQLGRRDDAEKAFRTAVALDPGDWTAHNALGTLYYNTNRFDEAATEYERMLALAPDNIRAYNNLGSAYLNQERFDKASEMFERSLSLERSATAYSNLGTALYQQGRYADAARSYESAVALPDATYLHWFNLGAACYWVPDLRGRAKEAYERAIALGEDQRASAPKVDASLASQLASSYAVLALLTDGAAAEEHRANARRLLDIAQQQPTSNPGLLARIGETYEELGDRTKALDVLGQALQAGYSMSAIERSPWLKELRADERYGRLKK